MHLELLLTDVRSFLYFIGCFSSWVESPRILEFPHSCSDYLEFEMFLAFECHFFLSRFEKLTGISLNRFSLCLVFISASSCSP